jgi:hypothetical protein
MAAAHAPRSKRNPQPPLFKETNLVTGLLTPPDRAQDHKIIARHDKFGTFPVPEVMNNTTKSAADAAAVTTKTVAKVAASPIEPHELTPTLTLDTPTLPWVTTSEVQLPNLVTFTVIPDPSQKSSNPTRTRPPHGNINLRSGICTVPAQFATLPSGAPPHPPGIVPPWWDSEYNPIGSLLALCDSWIVTVVRELLEGSSYHLRRSSIIPGGALYGPPPPPPQLPFLSTGARARQLNRGRAGRADAERLPEAGKCVQLVVLTAVFAAAQSVYS